jgi:6-phosphogluconate dehydrogenase
MAQAVIGLIGLGTMGANLVLNIAEKGFPIAVFNRTAEKTRAFAANAGVLAANITATETLQSFVAAIKQPRAIILMLTAGKAVDEQIAALRPLLGPDDIIIDAGNEQYQNTNRRAADAAAKGALHLGVGVSGGEEGARHGPSIMGGGPRAAWDRVAPVMTAISAKYSDGTPCAAWMGEGGAGHFVKMVHNGIEYADMQMIAEVYGVMRDGMRMTAKQCGAVFDHWNHGRLRSYLIEISAKVAEAVDPETGRPELDIIVDAAGQKGTGRWTAVEAQHLATPVTAIEAAVAARNISAQREQRKLGQELFGAAPKRIPVKSLPVEALEHGLIAGKILCYAQGFDMLSKASSEFGWNLPLPEIARIWREGCIIRSAMLNDMASALTEDPGRNLMFARRFSRLLKANQKELRMVVASCARYGLPSPALGAGLSYFDMMRTARGTANMIQGQRDFFGAHGFERFDKPGAHHGPWGGHE